MVFFLLQSVQPVVGRTSYDFVGALLSLPSASPFVHAFVRLPAYALTRAHLYSSRFFLRITLRRRRVLFSRCGLWASITLLCLNSSSDMYMVRFLARMSSSS